MTYIVPAFLLSSGQHISRILLFYGTYQAMPPSSHLHWPKAAAAMAVLGRNSVGHIASRGVAEPPCGHERVLAL
jgi:hypothetical protein